MSDPTPLLEFFKRGEVDRDARLLAARGALAPRAHEQLAILILLLDDADIDVREAAAQTLGRIPVVPLAEFLARSDVPVAIREFFAARGIEPAGGAAEAGDDPLVDAGAAEVDDEPGLNAPNEPQTDEARQSTTERLSKMGFSERLKAAVKGSREIRAILIRDPNRLIAASVLSSPKVTEQEVESFSRMANVSDEVLRIIGKNRSWTKNYGVVVGLTKNPKTPLAMSMNMMARLTDRDLQMLSIDRNIPEALRIAARKRLQAGQNR